MSKIDRVYYKLRARQSAYQRREETALAWLSARVADNCYVSWSAGKDSQVVAHLANRVHPGIPVLIADCGVPYHWTENERQRLLDYATAQGWSVSIYPWDKWSDAVLGEDRAESYRRLVHEQQFVSLTTDATTRGLNRRITGMRADESANRRKLLSSTRGETRNTLHPIWNWSVDDAWTYLVKHDVPWLTIYDHLGPHARNGLIGKNAKENGRLAFLRRYYPAAFARAAELFNARDYV